MNIVISMRERDMYRAEFDAPDLQIFQAARREQEARRLRTVGEKPNPLNEKWKALGEDQPNSMDGSKEDIVAIQGVYKQFFQDTPGTVASITAMIPTFEDIRETYRSRYDLGVKAGEIATVMETQLQDASISREVEGLLLEIEAWSTLGVPDSLPPQTP